MALRSEAAAALLLGDLLDDFVERANELRYRVMDLPNPMYEDEGGNCIQNGEDHSWRCVGHDGLRRKVTREEIRAEIRRCVGAALFAVLDGYGEDVTTIESIVVPDEVAVVPF